MSSHIRSSNTEAAILSRLIQVEGGDLSRSAADYFLSIRLGDAHDVARMNELSEAARQDKLTAEEQTELDSYIHVSSLLSIMKSKGRTVITRSIIGD